MIIGISGKIGSGKDSLADLIIKHNNQFEKKSYAYKLKKIGSLLTGTEESLWFTQEGKNIYLPEWNMTIGRFQQLLGTEAMRVGLHPNTWIISLFADLKEDSKWVITDVRFKNEAYAVKERGGFLLYLIYLEQLFYVHKHWLKANFLINYPKPYNQLLNNRFV